MTGNVLARTTIVAAVCLVFAAVPCRAADARDADIAEMKRAIDELRAQNRALADRLATLEAEKAAGKTAGGAAAVAGAGAAGGGVDRAAAATAAGPPSPSALAGDDLARRVRELELSKIAQEDATRAIIRDSVSTLGSKINDSVSLGGALEMLAARGRDFDGVSKSALQLNTAELDLDIQAGDWARASLVIEYIDGSNASFRTTRGFETSVDRFTVDTAAITVGDVQRFPLYATAGRINLGFGSSTGKHRADTLSIDGPLTIEAFQMRRPAVGIGWGLPTQPLTRAPLPVIVPAVRPMVLGPLAAAFARQLGYAPPPSRPKPPVPSSPPPEEPPFYGHVYLYEGNNIGTQRSFTRNVNARLGYRTEGHCGRPYSELTARDFCPWSLDVNLDYDSSVFDSQFLEAEYRPFIDQIGPVRGMAATIKATLGPVLVIAEWNGALGRAAFIDGQGSSYSIKPSAWQLSLGYQFDWNPWVQVIGEQGSYLALGYSRTSDLAGAVHVVDAANTRVGFLPRSRWTLTAGEWLLESLKLQLEYSRIQDYALDQGGTGATGNGIQMTLTYTW